MKYNQVQKITIELWLSGQHTGNKSLFRLQVKSLNPIYSEKNSKEVTEHPFDLVTFVYLLTPYIVFLDSPSLQNMIEQVIEMLSLPKKSSSKEKRLTVLTSSGTFFFGVSRRTQTRDLLLPLPPPVPPNPSLPRHLFVLQLFPKLQILD